MALPNLTLIQALRTTAERLQNGATYAWGNHGACNCGNLLQVVTHLTQQEIHAYAQTGIGEWTELAQEYCGVTNAPVDLLISKLQALGLNTSDIHNIEYLEDREVLNHLEGGFRWLSRNNRQDVIDYFNAFANLLESKLADKLPLNMENLFTTEKVAVPAI
ncbi:MAG: hypothetical protein EAZ47_02135 [Bacteroidetes bacterium]|nr:MAG: hypothetical protein EAY72_11455 [Bacteroidota bacterium]TAF96878.1 MAG: hypothetical protein EAZ47_02135 [Bacteroidota bacterium]